MGERVWATLAVPGQFGARTLELLKQAGFYAACTELSDYKAGAVYEFQEDEVNYASFLIEEQLQAQGIPYDKSYAGGGDFAAGLEIYRPETAGTPTLLQDLSDEAWKQTAQLLERIRAHHKMGTIPDLITRLELLTGYSSLDDLAENKLKLYDVACSWNGGDGIDNTFSDIVWALNPEAALHSCRLAMARSAKPNDSLTVLEYAARENAAHWTSRCCQLVSDRIYFLQQLLDEGPPAEAPTPQKET